MAPATALLDTTEANARRLLAAGLLALLAGVLLLVGLSSSAAAVVAGAVVVLGGPLVTFLSGGERAAKQALPPYLAAIALLLVALPVAHHWGSPTSGGSLAGSACLWGRHTPGRPSARGERWVQLVAPSPGRPSTFASRS